MTTERIRALIRARPFQPFTVHLADGRSFHVPHPEFVSMTPSGRVVIVTHGDEVVDFVDLLLVTSVELKPPSSSAA
jgi:hypothetical protein